MSRLASGLVLPFRTEYVEIECSIDRLVMVLMLHTPSKSNSTSGWKFDLRPVRTVERKTQPVIVDPNPIGRHRGKIATYIL